MKNPGYCCDTCMKLGTGVELERWWLLSDKAEHGICRLSLSPFVSEFANDKNLKHFCSRRCTDKYFHEWVKTAKNDKKKFAKYYADSYRSSFSAMFELGDGDDD